MKQSVPLWFRSHVARLAKANKVRSVVGSFRSLEHPERKHVVHRQAVTNVNTTRGTAPVLLRNYLRTDRQPTPAPVRLRTTHPMRAVLSRLELGTVISTTLDRAEPSLVALDARVPRLSFESDSAHLADELDRFDPPGVIGPGHLLARESIARPLALAELVSFEVIGRHLSHRQRPSSTALLATEPSCLGSRWNHGERGPAHLAHLGHRHGCKCTGRTFFGSGTTGVMARRLGRKTFGVELSPDYCALAAARFRQDVFDLGEPA